MNRNVRRNKSKWILKNCEWDVLNARIRFEIWL